MPDVSKTDLSTAVKYLEDALKLYDALAAIPMQKASCRAHMIRRLVDKLKSKIDSAQRDSNAHQLLNIIPNGNRLSRPTHAHTRPSKRTPFNPIN